METKIPMHGGAGVDNTSGYDPTIVYHSHSFNIPHLNTWIDELVRLTENGRSASEIPSTDNLVQAIQRYDAAFRELLRQTSIFSEPVTKLLAKVWAGVLKLLDYMIKSYHRYVRHSSGLQKQAQLLVAEKQSQAAASRVREDDFDLERTFLKARIRNLEAEIEAMQATKRGMDRENMQLRTILDVYVKSKELNDPVWDLLNEKPSDKAGSRSSTKPSSSHTQHRGDPGHGHHSSEAEDEDVDSAAHMKRKDGIDAGREQLRTLNRLDIEMNQVLVNVLKEDDRQRLLVADLTKLLQANQHIFGPGGVVGNKWVSGHGALAGNKRDNGTQVDLKDDFGVVTELVETVREEIHIPPPFSANSSKVRGSSVPNLFRAKMTSFPHVLRIPPAAWVCQTILSIYTDKISTDDVSTSRKKTGLAEHVYDYFLRTLGLASVADMQVAQLLQACEVYMKIFVRVSLFASQIGLYDKEATPTMDVRDTDFILSIIRHLVKLGELVPEKASRRKLSTPSVVVKPDISRSAAVTTLQLIFEKWLEDGGQDYVLKVKAMSGTERGTKYIDLDNFIELMIEPWHTVRLGWEDHLHYVFHENCTVHRVLSEAQFANDAGVKERDTILSQLSKASATDCPRRPLRLFQRKESNEKVQDEMPVGRRPPGKLTSVAKEPVCELMNRKTFINTLSILNPALRYDKVRESLSFLSTHIHMILYFRAHAFCSLHRIRPPDERNVQRGRRLVPP